MKRFVPSLSFRIVLLLGLIFAIIVAPATAQDTAPEVQQTAAVKAKPVVQPGPFAKGKVRVGFYAGAGSSFNQSYVILGAGLGYYLLDGLEIGADVEGWLGKDSTIWKVTPQVRYVFWQMNPIRPYAGAFWRQNYIGDPFEDYSSFGGRAGIAYQSGRNYVAVGLVYEKFNDCDFGDCDSTYPEISFWMSF